MGMMKKCFISFFFVNYSYCFFWHQPNVITTHVTLDITNKLLAKDVANF